MKKILLLGASSAIGTAFNNAYSALYDIERYTCRGHVVDAENVESYLNLDDRVFKNKDFILYFGGIANVQYCEVNPKECYYQNFLVPTQLAARAARHGVKFIHFSSASVWGSPAEKISASTRFEPISVYGRTKLECEQALAILGNCVNIRLFSTYGPTQEKLFVFDFLNKLKKLQFSLVDEVELRGNGESSRDFVHIDGICHVISNIFDDKLMHSNTIIVCSGKTFSTSEVVHLSGEMLAIDVDKYVRFGASEAKSVPDKWDIDVDSFKGDIVCLPDYAFPYGILEMYQSIVIK